MSEAERQPHTHCQFQRHPTHSFHNLEQFFLRYLRLTITFEVSCGNSITCYVTVEYWQSLLSRLRPHGISYLYNYIYCWRVVITSSTTKRIVDVHRLISTTQTTTGGWVTTIASICCACLSSGTQGVAIGILLASLHAHDATATHGTLRALFNNNIFIRLELQHCLMVQLKEYLNVRHGPTLRTENGPKQLS